MGQPFKRVRLSKSPETPVDVISLEETHIIEEQVAYQGQRAAGYGSKSDIRRRHNHAHLHEARRIRLAQEMAILEARDPATTATATVVNVIIEDGTTQIAALTVPNVPTVLTVGTVVVTVGASTSIVQIGESTTDSGPTPLPTESSLTTSVPSQNLTGTSTTTATLEIINGTLTSTISPTFSTLSTSNSSRSLPPFTTLSSFAFPSPSDTPEASSPSSSESGAEAPSPTIASGDGSDSGSDSNSSPLPTPKIVGGVVGGLAGLVFLLLAILWLLRRHRKRLEERGDLTPSGSVAGPSERSSGVPFFAAIAPVLGKLRHSDRQQQIRDETAATSTAAAGTAAASEKGFQKLGGRKIPSVLAGGDAYGGNYGAFEKEGGVDASQREPSIPPSTAVAGASFYRDSQGFHGGRGISPVASSTALPQAGASAARDFGGTGEEAIAVMRPSPARTPVQASTSVPSLITPASSVTGTPPRVPGPLLGPDAIGRTLSMHDGSRGSRFTESV